MPTKEQLLSQAEKPAEDAMRLHAFYRGKVQVLPKCSVRNFEDFAVWYTPGVAAPCRAIEKDRERGFELTNRANCIAIVSDGTRVLGLGDIGPEAGMPVMEGKALLFKYLGGIDAVPICLGTRDPEEIVRTVKLLEPSFGGINLEDISQPKCFRILGELRERMTIPVWHDDQQGSGTALLAGLLSALKIVKKDIHRIRIVMIGMGAANVSVYRFLKSSGADPGDIVACDSKGILHKGRKDIEMQRDLFADKWKVCQETNRKNLTGGIPDALHGADVCIAFSRSGPGIIAPEWIGRMARDPVLFACANPVPEIWPWEAKEAGARIVSTGRSDFPNQVNNSLVFPGIFRGALDVRASSITDEMALAAAHELVLCAEKGGIHDANILPKMDQWDVVARVAAAVGRKAQEQGIAKLKKTENELFDEASRKIKQSHAATRLLIEQEIIPRPPSGRS